MGDSDHHQGDQEPGAVASSTATGTATGGHLSRQFRLAYGEPPYRYLMTRRIEPATALLRRGDRSATQACFAVGCGSLGTFSSRFTELVGMPPSTYRRQGGAGDGGDAVVRGEPGDQTDQESRSAAPRAAANVTAMDTTIHASFLPHDDPPAAGQAHSNTSFIARGRSSNGRSEHEANSKDEATRRTKPMPKR